MIQAMSFGRNALLSPFGIEDKAWDMRHHRGEVALAFGLSRPAFTNEYGEHDLIAVGLQLMAGRHVGHRLASQAVRDYWREWEEGLAMAERMKPWTPTYSGICFVVTANDAKTKALVEIGPCEKAVHKLGKADASLVPFVIPFELLLRRIRGAAEEVGLTLPDPLTPGLPKSPEFKRWLAEIEEFRKTAARPRTMLTTAE